MPTVNAYVATEEQQKHLLTHCLKLQAFLAQELSCNELALQFTDFTLRVMMVPREGRMADVELDITAQAFPERVERHDAACFNIQAFLKGELGLDAKVWLALCELGHNIRPIS